MRLVPDSTISRNERVTASCFWLGFLACALGAGYWYWNNVCL